MFGEVVFPYTIECFSLFILRTKWADDGDICTGIVFGGLCCRTDTASIEVGAIGCDLPAFISGLKGDLAA
jgi:hypothetical protein